MQALAGVDSLVLVGRKRDRGKTKSFSVVVRDVFSPPVRAHRCRTVSSSVHWKFVSYHFLALVPRQVCPFFLRSIANALMLYLNSKSGIRDNGKQFVEWHQAKKTINGGSQMDLIELTVSHPSSTFPKILSLRVLLPFERSNLHQSLKTASISP